MPFTFCHPALVLPLNYLPKQWFSLTALVVGSMTPDFEYFLRLRVSGIYSHTFSGLFWFDLPLGILIAFVFHNLVKVSLINNMTVYFKSRFVSYSEINWNNYFRQHFVIVIISMLIGIASHLLWDGFTHKHGYFTDQIPLLKQYVALSQWEIPVYKILQHGSTFVGFAIVFLAVNQLPVHHFMQKTNLRYWHIVIFITILALGLRLCFFKGNTFGNLLVSAIAFGMMALIITPLLLKTKLFETK